MQNSFDRDHNPNNLTTQNIGTEGTRILKDIHFDADITDFKVIGSRTNSQGKKVRILKVKKKKKKTNKDV